MADENLKDPMSGYASGDLLGPREKTKERAAGETVPNTKDPMSGYASADEIAPADDKKKKR